MSGDGMIVRIKTVVKHMPTYTDALTDTYFDDTYTDTVHELPHVDDAMQWHFFRDILIIMDFAMCFHICIALTY